MAESTDGKSWVPWGTLRSQDRLKTFGDLHLLHREAYPEGSLGAVGCSGSTRGRQGTEGAMAPSVALRPPRCPGCCRCLGHHSSEAEWLKLGWTGPLTDPPTPPGSPLHACVKGRTFNLNSPGPCTSNWVPLESGDTTPCLWQWCYASTSWWAEGRGSHFK